jgi:hypothetical protein
MLTRKGPHREIRKYEKDQDRDYYESRTIRHKVRILAIVFKLASDIESAYL